MPEPRELWKTTPQGRWRYSERCVLSTDLQFGYSNPDTPMRQQEIVGTGPVMLTRRTVHENINDGRRDVRYDPLGPVGASIIQTDIGFAYRFLKRDPSMPARKILTFVRSSTPFETSKDAQEALERELLANIEGLAVGHRVREELRTLLMNHNHAD